MYSTCIFCHAWLGANDAIETFPVGRRLAFDAAKGRLWVVCRRCGRWNLSPLHERWEAIEACERRFRDSRTRASTENVGLARLSDGTDLVRIGRPLRPEFAAWRYGDQFGTRVRKKWVAGVIAGGVVAGVAHFAAPLLLFAVYGLSFHLLTPRFVPPHRATRLRALSGSDGEPLLRPNEVVTGARLRPEPRDGAAWWLEVKSGFLAASGHNGPLSIMDERRTSLVGSPAVEAASILLAYANTWGGSKREVRSAVRRIEHAGDPERYFVAAEGEARKLGWGYQELWKMPKEVRLALEMASHEDAERRAMEGELAELERRWRTAEEIAAIADRLVIPKKVERDLARLRSRKPSG